MIIVPMYICICNAITERDVRECVRRGCCSMEELSGELGVRPAELAADLERRFRLG